MIKRIVGLALVAVAIGLILLSRLGGGGPGEMTLKILYGGEKSRYINNEQTQKLLREQFGITLDATRRGSIEMATSDDTTGVDCIWPSNQIAVQLAEEAGKPVLRDENIFNSPMVLYAWSDVTRALVDAGLVDDSSQAYLTIDTNALVEAILAGKRWQEDFGLNIYGPLKVFSTDPRKSNSGNMWAGLLINVLNGGNVATTNSPDQVYREVADYFARLGFMEHSSGDIFENFLKQGMGSRPIIVGYENQLPEFILENQDYAELIAARIDIIYPAPTVFASHPLISLTPACQKLEEALKDARLQEIAWRDHGFRTGLLGVENDPKLLSVAGIPEAVDLVVPLPEAAVMQRIAQTLR